MHPEAPHVACYHYVMVDTSMPENRLSEDGKKILRHKEVHVCAKDIYVVVDKVGVGYTIQSIHELSRDWR